MNGVIFPELPVIKRQNRPKSRMRRQAKGLMMRLLKFLVVIVVLAFLALTGYAYLGDMAPRQQEMHQPVALDTGTVSNVPAAAVVPKSEPATEETSADGTEEADPNGLD
ncbi:MAG: hypothetical protein ACK5LJ_05060 [Paracoccus sp. (in: a-proteobacteria)]